MHDRCGAGRPRGRAARCLARPGRWRLDRPAVPRAGPTGARIGARLLSRTHWRGCRARCASRRSRPMPTHAGSTSDTGSRRSRSATGPATRKACPTCFTNCAVLALVGVRRQRAKPNDHRAMSPARRGRTSLDQCSRLMVLQMSQYLHEQALARPCRGLRRQETRRWVLEYRPDLLGLVVVAGQFRHLQLAIAGWQRAAAVSRNAGSLQNGTFERQ